MLRECASEGEGVNERKVQWAIKARLLVPPRFVRKLSVEFGYADHRPLRLSTHTPADGLFSALRSSLWPVVVGR